MLRKVGAPPIGLVQFHVWQDEWADNVAWQGAVEALRREGLARFVGISVNRREPSNVLRTLRTGLIDAVQVVYNIFDQSPEDELFPLCRELGIAVIARVPLDEGSLTGELTLDSRWPDGDWRNTYFTPSNLGETVQRVEALRPLVPEGETMAQLALRFILSNPDVTTVIPGMRRPEHLADNIAAAEAGPLPARADDSAASPSLGPGAVARFAVVATVLVRRGPGWGLPRHRLVDLGQDPSDAGVKQARAIGGVEVPRVRPDDAPQRVPGVVAPWAPRILAGLLGSGLWDAFGGHELGLDCVQQGRLEATGVVGRDREARGAVHRQAKGLHPVPAGVPARRGILDHRDLVRGEVAGEHDREGHAQLVQPRERVGQEAAISAPDGMMIDQGNDAWPPPVP